MYLSSCHTVLVPTLKLQYHILQHHSPILKIAHTICQVANSSDLLINVSHVPQPPIHFFH